MINEQRASKIFGSGRARCTRTPLITKHLLIAILRDVVCAMHVSMTITRVRFLDR